MTEKTMNEQPASEPVPPRRGLWAWLLRQLGTVLDILRERCPRCRQGRMFRGRFDMNDPCPVCGLIFQREEGYFLGAMYVSYLLSSFFLISFYFLGRWLLPDWNTFLVTFLALLLYLPLVPAMFRYSRIVWIYFERAGCPSDVSATVYEKTRLAQDRRARP
jgi:uncharacterized protein (DUF983 family)